MTDTEQETEAPALEPDAAEPDAEPAGELEAEPEPEADSNPTEPADTEARAPSAAELRKFEAENTRHEKALEKIIGRDWAEFGECLECGGVGFRPLEAMAAPELVDLPDAIECPGCRGYGRLRTPSRVPGHELQLCVECAGNGWKRAERQAAAEAPAYFPPMPNGSPGVPPGHILVKIDPSAPDVPASSTPQPLAAVPAQP